MKQRLVLAAVAALCASTLTACGGGTKAYCDDLRDAKSDFSSLGADDIGKFDEIFSRVHKLADEAPDEVADDWKVFDDTLSGFQAALKKAGLTTDDLEKMSAGQVPENFDMSKLEQLQEDMTALSSQKFEDASDNIQKHAKDECNVDLDAS